MLLKPAKEYDPNLHMHWPLTPCEDATAVAIHASRWLPKFSTDITYAWQVVEKVGEGRLALNPVKLSQTLQGWCCRVRVSVEQCVVADGEAAPLAICRAALLIALSS